jgi:CRP-like cAMP-binding protein
MLITHTTPTANRLLAALPLSDQQRFMAACEQVEVSFGEELAEPGERIRHVYFPTDSFISLTASVGENTSLEVGMVGNEGMLGVSLILGIPTSPMHAVVQGGGPILRMPVRPFLGQLKMSLPLLRLLKRYLFVLIGQLVQSSACTRFHVVEARLARWLLMTQDRAHSPQIHLTQEFLASMLGVRRVGVTKAASSLQKQKLIHYQRGNITILDRQGLEVAACACYAADIATYARMLN